MLDLECFTYLNALLESPMAPTVVLATNRGHARVRGAPGVVGAHGLPSDLLDRCLIVKTDRYARAQIAQILHARAATEGLRLGAGVLERLAERGDAASLRYALQLLTPAAILARLAGRSVVEEEDVDEMGALFLDAKTSAGAMPEGML
jgi:RuvB-like protein 1 (pontin 52)